MGKKRSDNIIVTKQCNAETKRRGSNKNGRCKHTTSSGEHCHQHKKTLDHRKVTKSIATGERQSLYTTEAIKAGETINDLTGEHLKEKDVNFNHKHLLKVAPDTYIDSRHTDDALGRWTNQPARESETNSKFVYNPATHRVTLKAKEDIKPNEEILATWDNNYWNNKRTYANPNIKELRNKRKKKKKPVEEEPLDDNAVFIPEPEPVAPPRKRRRIVEEEPVYEDEAPKAPRKPRKPVPKKSANELGKLRQQRNVKNMIDRLETMETIMNSKKIADLAGLKLPKHKIIIIIPNQGKLSILDYTVKLENLLKRQETSYYEYMKTAAKTKYTKQKALELVDKMIAKHKRKH